MPDEDASLADFVDDDGARADADGAEVDDDETGPSVGGAEPDLDAAGTDVDDDGIDADGPTTGAAPDELDAEPAVPTATWNPDGACERCGGTAPRRWRDGNALVCADCRDW